ncbi:hypothetical protein BVC80_8991g40 [Macleaya cordata]|uniref:Uncharacterized protein n=1 Tax=Macleaya cordata TaxID=56857 RepID=A0A200QBQ5_MACCD|nr:hypothetical protein BVC80_8991g40 [Macleaya cordata]
MTTMDSVVLDIESLVQSSDISSGSPKMTRALARKGSCRMERKFGAEEEETDLASKKLLVKVNSHLEPLISSKAVSSSAPTTLTDMSDGRSKRFNRLIALNPRKILLIFATVSSMGTMILIYFTLAINRRGWVENGVTENCP